MELFMGAAAYGLGVKKVSRGEGAADPGQQAENPALKPPAAPATARFPRGMRRKVCTATARRMKALSFLKTPEAAPIFGGSTSEYRR